MYAEKIGGFSVRSPREMMIPIGSVDSVISRTFFMRYLLNFRPGTVPGVAIIGTRNATSAISCK